MTGPLRPVLGMLLLAVTAGSVVASVGPADASYPGTPDGDVRPNVLLINLDDATEKMIDWQKPDGSWVMPNAQAFKAASTVYPNTIVDIPSCCPSRFSMFTGRYPHNTGAKRQGDARKLPVKETFVHLLAESAGYQTAMAGKFLNSWTLPRRPPTFDRFTTMMGGYDDPVMNRNGFVNTVRGYSTTILAEDLLDSIGRMQRDGGPWYAYWAPQAPHINGGWKTLALPEDKYDDVDMGLCAQLVELNRSDKPGYVRGARIDTDYNQALCTSQLRAMITVDDRFGELLAHLRASDDYDETMIVLTSDNGFHWGEQGWFSKFYPYEASINIPLIVKWPSALAIPPGVDGRLASSLDLTATIFEVAGVDPMTELDGDPLLAPATRDDVLVEYFVDPANGEAIPSWSLLRGPTWKYIETRRKDDAGELRVFKEYYDLVADPGEQTNVLHDDVTGNEPPRSVLRRLASELEAARACAGAGCP